MDNIERLKDAVIEAARHVRAGPTAQRQLSLAIAAYDMAVKH